jgi:hypothetical protein
MLIEHQMNGSLMSRGEARVVRRLPDEQLQIT